MEPRTLPESLLLALALAGGGAGLAYALGALRASGVVGGLLVGIPVVLGLGWPGFAVLSVMVGLGILFTRLAYARKRGLGVAQEGGGARGAEHALANIGVAAVCAAMAGWTGDPIYTVAFLGALATSTMDTAGSETGPLFPGRPWSLRNLRPAVVGTPGAMSVGGTLIGVVAALLVALAGNQVGLAPASAVPAILLGAVVGNVTEALLGSRGLLSHHVLNALSTGVGAGISALAA